MNTVSPFIVFKIAPYLKIDELLCIGQLCKQFRNAIFPKIRFVKSEVVIMEFLDVMDPTTWEIVGEIRNAIFYQDKLNSRDSRQLFMFTEEVSVKYTTVSIYGTEYTFKHGPVIFYNDYLADSVLRATYKIDRLEGKLAATLDSCYSGIYNGKIVNGVIHGPFIIYDENGSIDRIRIYDSKKNTGDILYNDDRITYIKAEGICGTYGFCYSWPALEFGGHDITHSDRNNKSRIAYNIKKRYGVWSYILQKIVESIGRIMHKRNRPRAFIDIANFDSHLSISYSQIGHITSVSYEYDGETALLVGNKRIYPNWPKKLSDTIFIEIINPRRKTYPKNAANVCYRYVDPNYTKTDYLWIKLNKNNIIATKVVVETVIVNNIVIKINTIYKTKIDI
jgi:hypothetical protein